MSLYPDLYGFNGMEDFGQLEDVLIAIIGVYLVILLLASIYSLVVYILNSLGMYSIAKRRGIHHPWLAWIPIANVWVLGSVSDQYQYVAKNKVTNRRKILLGLSIPVYILAWVVIALCVRVLIDAVMFAGSSGDIAAQLLGSLGVVYLLDVVMLIVAIIQTVFVYIAYYDLFVSSRPGSAVAFLVLGIFFNFLLPYFVFACRKRDDGMPVRQAPVQPVIPQYMPPAQPMASESDFETEE